MPPQSAAAPARTPPQSPRRLDLGRARPGILDQHPGDEAAYRVRLGLNQVEHDVAAAAIGQDDDVAALEPMPGSQQPPAMRCTGHADALPTAAVVAGNFPS